MIRGFVVSFQVSFENLLLPWYRQLRALSTAFCEILILSDFLNESFLTFVSPYSKIPWRRERLLIQYSGPENSIDCIVHGGHKELDTTVQLSLSLHLQLLCESLNPYSQPLFAQHA